MPLPNLPADAPAERDPAIEDLEASADDFVRARRGFVDAVRESDDPCGDQVEMAAADLLRQAVSTGEQIRRVLAALMVGYALLWIRAQRYGADDDDDLDDFDDDLDDLDAMYDLDEPDDFDDDDFDDFDPDDLDVAAGVDGASDEALEALDRMTENLERLIEDSGKTFEGRSGDGRVKAVADHRGRLIELDFDPRQLGDPAYRAAVVEAINAAVGPVAQRRHEMATSYLPELLAQEPATLEPDAGTDAIFDALSAMGAAEHVQPDLAKLLASISRGGDPRLVTEAASQIEKICRDAERWLRDCLPFLDGFCRSLPAKARLPGIAEGDLTDLEGLAQLFLELELDQDPELESFPGADLDWEHRESIAEVADELQRRDEARQDRLFRQRAARRIQSQVAEVEGQTFEARSGENPITARVRGTVELIDLELDPDLRADPAAIETAVLDAVNTALEEAARERSQAASLPPVD